MAKDIYKWWSKKALKNEILKLKLTYNELFNATLKVQEENRDLRKTLKITDDANTNLRDNNKDLRKLLNDKSFVKLEEEITKQNEQLTKAKEIIKELYEGLDKLYLSGLSAKQIAFIEQLQDKTEPFLSEVEK